MKLALQIAKPNEISITMVHHFQSPCGFFMLWNFYDCNKSFCINNPILINC